MDARIDRVTTELELIVAAKKAALNGTKASAILAGVQPASGESVKAYGDQYDGDPFLWQIREARRGDPDANRYVKSVLGTSDATGQAIVPNNFVARLADIARAKNVWRQLMNVS